MAQDTRRKVVASASEERLSKMADKMLREGSRDFEGTYGSKTPGSFNVKKDVADLQGVGIMNDQQGRTVTRAQSQNQLPPNPQSQPVPQPAPQAATPTAPPVETPPVAPDAPPVAEAPVEQPELSNDPEKRLEQVVEALKKINPNPPTVDTLKQWKQIHGNIFLLNVEDHVFIYRYLKRQENIQINANPHLEEMQEHQIEEMLFDRCVLWPSFEPIQKAGFPAGAMTMVVQQIRVQSLFLDPAYVAQLTFKI